MKKQLLIFAFVLINASIMAQQPQQQIWYLDNQSIDFRTYPPIITQGLPGGGIASIYESRNGVHNQNGDLLFYMDGSYIINKLGNIFGMLFPFDFPQSELVIIPVPS